MPDAYRVIIERDAEKVLAKLPRDLGMRWRDAIKDLGQNLRPQGVKRLQGQHDLYRRRVGNWRIVYAIQHDHIANRRADFLKKIVHGLVVRYDCIAIEDLQIGNLAQNRHLSKSILDAGWGYFRLQLAFKAAWAGKTVVAAPPAYTSKTCSQCGSLFAHLTLADRWVKCDCGLSLDRDENAARNLLRVGQTRWGVTWPVAASVPQEAVGL